MTRLTIVVDANILISALITPGKVRRVFFHEKLHPVAPQRIVEETIKHTDTIARYTGIDKTILKTILPETLTRWITTINTDEIPSSTIIKSRRLVRDVDPSDWPFVALAIHLGAPLWTGDKKLIRLALKTGDFKAVDTHGVEMLLQDKPWSEIEEEMRKRYLQEPTI